MIRTHMIRINAVMEKWTPLIAPGSLVLGILLARWLSPYTGLVPWIFAFMTFAGSLGSSFGDLKRVLARPLPLLASLLLLHVWMPLVGWAAGSLFFPADMYTITGILLAFTIPTGIISFMWVSMFKGNIAVTLSLILIDTFLSPFIVPYTLKISVGADVQIDTLGMMRGLLWMVVLPSLLGMVLNHLTKGRIKTGLGPLLAPFSKIGLVAVISINGSVVAPYMMDFDWKLVQIALVILLVAASGYLFGLLAARLCKWDRGITVAMTFNCGMRNISAGTVLAMTYFAPAVVLPVILGSLFQQILASSYAQVLRFIYRKQDQAALSGEIST
ncbi:bile acid:sodium symporter family protein [Paenibacillus terreus]|uniref:Bile acid:sodium symporter family protein n=1 Tax=Paenibacillus terreus TaxID=1387834 RepID=A0ABV5BEC3_9BACL